MKVKELIELNQMITDVEITVRDHGSTLLDQLNIGPERGEKPPYPTRVPRKREYAGSGNQGNDLMYKEAAYIPKSINAWDDGHDYWQVKPNRIPSAWLELEVFSWEAREASCICHTSPRRRNGFGRNVNFHGQQLNVVALPSGQTLSVPEPKEKNTDDQLDGQMSIEEWIEG